MAWIRLDDDYVYHPKFTVLSDRAFRLWHEGMGYCRKMLTDGLILSSALKTFRYATRRAVKELLTPASDGIAPLWVPDQKGVRVHDYLDWNPSQEEDQRDRDAAKQRMRAFRGKAKSPPVTAFVTAFVTPPVTPPVPGQGQGLKESTERESERKQLPALASYVVSDRAALLLQLYADWYCKYRHGAKLRLVGSNLDFQDACSICGTWDDARIEKLAQIVLTTDDEFITKTDRSFKIFALKASWADDRLRQAEGGAA